MPVRGETSGSAHSPSPKAKSSKVLCPLSTLLFPLFLFFCYAISDLSVTQAQIPGVILGSHPLNPSQHKQPLVVSCPLKIKSGHVSPAPSPHPASTASLSSLIKQVSLALRSRAVSPPVCFPTSAAVHPRLHLYFQNLSSLMSSLKAIHISFHSL